uniref:Uncharacterized protein n=1 Tax=Nicotiana tabacum TaxID=4097 RepID=A0A1S3XH61_TOBAC|nr:PREDICTED: uncharacterized protein LOC107765145 [Nicotiana tabacum]
MTKTSKIVPRKANPSSSKPSEDVTPAATEEPTPEPPPQSFVPSGCPTGADYKIENTPLVPGLPKVIEMRPPSADDDIFIDPPAPKQDKKKKRRKTPSSSVPERKIPRKRMSHIPKKASARELSTDTLLRFRDESEEEEDYELVVRVRSGSEMPQAMEAVEEAVAEVSGRVETDFPRSSEVEEETMIGISRSEDNVPKEAFGALKGNLGEGAQGAVDSSNNFFDGLDSATSEDVTGLGDVPIPRKISSPGASWSSSSPKLMNQFPALSVDRTRRHTIVLSVSEDTRVLSAPVKIVSYLRCLVTEEDQEKMNEVEAPCLFNEAQQALSRGSVLHHEGFLRYREEFKHHEAETREFVEKKDAYKLLNEKSQDELEAARREHSDLVEQVKIVFEISDDESDLVTNDLCPQLQKQLDVIKKLREEVDKVKAKTEE